MGLELVNWCPFFMALRFLLHQLQETQVKFYPVLDIIPLIVHLRMMYTMEKMKTTWFPAQSRSKSTGRLLYLAGFLKGISTSDIAPGFLRQSMFTIFVYNLLIFLLLQPSSICPEDALFFTFILMISYCVKTDVLAMYQLQLEQNQLILTSCWQGAQ